tara:strand:- start:625 stop:858 length:234 start_codon:yes stop_codon:yes gene_type:complete
MVSLTFLLVVIGITFFSSVLIISKYVDFAKFMIERKDKNIVPHVIQFNHPRSFKKRSQQDIIIDIPVKDVKVLNNDN